MKSWFLLLTIGLLGMGCATAPAAGPAAAGPQPPWFAENVPSETHVETDGGTAQPSVVIEAISPTQVQYRTEGETVVLRSLPAPSKVRVRTHQGMWIGGAVGILGAVMMSAASERSANADPDCAGAACGAGVILGGAVFGAIGLGLGAAVGAIIGKLEGL
jgi:hypothetical protein